MPARLYAVPDDPDPEISTSEHAARRRPPDLIALEIEHRAEIRRVNEQRGSEPGACGYRIYLLGKQVAYHRG